MNASQFIPFFLLFYSYCIGQNTELSKLPTTITWHQYQFLGTPSDLSSKKLVYIDYVTEVSTIGLRRKSTTEKINSRVRKELKQYPYSYEALTRKALMEKLKKEPISKFYDYQLKLVYDQNKGFTLLLEDLHTGLRYCLHKELVYKFDRLIKKFIPLIVDNPEELRKYYYNAIKRRWCNENGQTGSLKSGRMQCPIADYKGFPPDLMEKTLVFVELPPITASWKALNTDLKKMLEKKYPFNAKILAEATSPISNAWHYQLRISKAYEATPIPVYLDPDSPLPSTHSLTNSYFIIIEDLHTGEIYAPVETGIIHGKVGEVFMKVMKSVFGK